MRWTLNARRVLLDRITALADQLGQARQAVEWAAESYRSASSASLTDGRDSSRLKECIKEHRDSLTALRSAINGTSKPAPEQSAAWWQGHAAVRRNCDTLFAECLAYAIGPLTRGLPWKGKGLDGGLCHVADEMLEQLTVPTDQLWSRRTVLSDSEFMGEPAQIIRLRFPVTAIWDLPVAAHEFGHLLGLRHEFEATFKDLAPRNPERNWVHEYFADVFATYVLGPAFACTCLLTRFDPAGDPNRSSDTHPSDGLRARAILWTLAEMERELGDYVREMSSISELLSETWQACLSSAAPRGGGIEGSQEGRLQRWCTRLYSLIDKICSAAKYARWPRAVGLAGRISPEAGPPRQEELIDTTIRDLVNAAWQARTCLYEEAYEVGQVSRQALSWCRELIGVRGRPGV
jgi:hypothetical protein